MEGVIYSAPSTVAMVESRGAAAGADLDLDLDQLRRESGALGSSDESQADLLRRETDTVEAEAAAAVASEEGEQPWFRTADRSVKEEGRGRDECVVGV